MSKYLLYFFTCVIQPKAVQLSAGTMMDDASASEPAAVSHRIQPALIRASAAFKGRVPSHTCQFQPHGSGHIQRAHACRAEIS